MTSIVAPETLLRRWVVFDDVLNLLVVCFTVLLEQVVCFGLRRRLWVWVVKQVLDPQKNLLDCNGRFPAFFLVQDGETDGSGGIDIRMEERRHEFTCQISAEDREIVRHLSYILAASLGILNNELAQA